MIMPEFMRFYGYTAGQAFAERAITFFALVNAMYRIAAKEAINDFTVIQGANAGKEGQSVLDNLKKQERGLHGIVNEVRNVKP